MGLGSSVSDVCARILHMQVNCLNLYDLSYPIIGFSLLAMNFTFYNYCILVAVYHFVDIKILKHIVDLQIKLSL